MKYVSGESVKYPKAHFNNFNNNFNNCNTELFFFHFWSFKYVNQLVIAVADLDNRFQGEIIQYGR